jgi:inhibitor of KinA
MSLNVEPYGPRAFMVRFAAHGDSAAFDRAQALLVHLEHHPPVGLVEATPGFTTLLLEFEPGQRPDPTAFSAQLQRVVRHAPTGKAPGRTIELPVVYDGPDLERVAQAAGLPVSEVVRRHAAGMYRVHLLGFAPGFPYLSGLDRRLHTPRLATPRPQVPAGSVAIGGEHTGVYPVATAGGWNLIGRTDAPLLDLARAAAGETEAFLMQPGYGVRFVVVGHLG